MTTITIAGLPTVTSVQDTALIPSETAGITQNFTAATLKTYMSSLGNLVVSGNISVGQYITGSLLTSNQPNITSLGTLTGLTLGGQLVSTVSTGTAPIVVTSTTQVGNLYVARANVADTATNGLTTFSTFTTGGSSDISFSGNNSSLVGTLNTVNLTTGTFGGNIGYTYYIPRIIVNSKGLVTAASNVAVNLDLSSQTVTNLSGTNNQIVASANTGAVTLSLPSQLNIINLTASGTISPSANVAYNIGSGTNYWNTIYSQNFTGVNVTGTLQTPAQPNITSVGTLTGLNVSGQIVSTVSTGTAPFSVASTTQVPNLYAARAALADTTTNGLTTSSTFTDGVASDATFSGNNSSLVATLKTVNGTTGVFGGISGSTYYIPQVNVNGKGLVTSVSNISLNLSSQAVTSLSGTSNQISVNGNTGAVTLSLPSQINITNITATGTVAAAVVTDSSNRVLTGVTVAAGTGMSGGGTITGPTGSITINNAGVTSLSAGTGIGVSASTGGITVTNNGVVSFNSRTGAISLSSTDINNALGYTPYNSSNPAGYLNSSSFPGTTAGYQKLPSGIVIQWGTTGAVGIGNYNTATYTTNFPISFPNACLMVVGGSTASGAITSGQQTGVFNVSYWNASSFNWMFLSPNNGNGGATVFGAYIAIGY